MSIQNQKTLEAYQVVAKNYLENTKLADSIYKEKASKVRKDLRNFIKETFKEIPKCSKVLEIGSADGVIAKYIQKLGFDVTPSDVSDVFLNAIKENGLSPIKFNVLTDVFKDNYSAIFCWKVFVHFTKGDVLKALRNSYSGLEEKGLLVFNVISKECKSVDDEWIDFPGIYHLGKERYFKYYSKKEMDNIINKTKFQIIKFNKIITENDVKWLVYVLKK